MSLRGHCSPQHATQVVIPWPRVCAWATREQEYGCLDFCWHSELPRSKSHTMGFPPKRGVSGNLTVKKGRLFPTVWPDGSNEYGSSIGINLKSATSLILAFCFYFRYLFSLSLDYLLASLGSSLRSMRAFSSCIERGAALPCSVWASHRGGSHVVECRL